MSSEQIIFTTSSIRQIRNEFFVGMEIPVLNENILSEDHTPQREIIRVTRMYRDFAQVTNGRYMWCIRYLDLFKMVHPAFK